MTRRLVLSLLVTIFCVSAGSLQTVYASPPWSGLTDYTITVGGFERTYHVHLPASYTGVTPMPLVVAFHGAYSNGAGMAGLTNFNNVADSNGVIAAYPDAINGVWNTDGSAPQDDFAFVSAVIQQMSSTFVISSQQIYAMGFSNGAVFTEELGCKLSSQLAAIASVSGHMPSTFPCPLSHPMPLITMHGTADPLYSYAGWADAKYGQHLMGAVDAEDTWASLASCTAQPITNDLPNVVWNDGTAEELRVIGSCAGGVQMQLYTIFNGGHTWPGGFPLPYFGLTSLDIDASTLIWQFFAQYQN